MLWPFFTIVSLALFALSILIDKHMLNKVKDPMVFWGVCSVFNIAAALGVWILFGFSISTDIAFIAAAIGVAVIFPAWAYYRTIQPEEVSRAYPLLELYVPVTVVLSAFLLGEIFGLATYAGIAVIVIGAILVSFKRDGHLHKIIRSPALPYALASALMTGAITVARKWLLLQADWLQVFAAAAFGTWFGFMILLYYRRNELQMVMHKRVSLGWAALSTVLTLAGVASLTLAYSLGPASLVSALTAAQPVILFVVAIILSEWAPKFLHEDLKGSIMLLKAVAIALVVIGSLLVLQ